MKSKKLKAILSISGYFLLVLSLCFVGGLVFHSYYYEPIYVSGSSMSPTLNGADNEKSVSVVDFGIVDNHASAINHIKRFSIISTYYPTSDDYKDNGELRNGAKKKIKRVIALPNETFQIKDGLLSVKKDGEFISVKYDFEVVKTTAKDTTEPITLGKDEYWCLGDNRPNSHDCASIGKPIKKSNISGVLVAIEGQAKLKQKRMVCYNCGKGFSSGETCPNCYYPLNPEYELVNKSYSWPKFY